MTAQDIRGEIIRLAEPELAAFSKKLTPTALEIKGVRIPLLRKLAKEAAKIPGFLDEFQPENYEEVMVAGFVSASQKTLDALFTRMDAFLPRIDNWAVCDCVCSTVGLAKKFPAETLAHFMPLKDSPKEFDRRFFAVFLMDYCLTDEHISFVLDAYSSMKCGEYYVDMAIAWGLATALAKYYEETVALIETRTLPPFIQNKAIQKARESFRVSAAQKEYLNTLKVPKSI